MSKKTSNKRNLALGGLVLAGVSYVAGLLTAPKSGKETRKDIKNTAAKAKLEAEKKLKHAHSELNSTIDNATKKASTAKDGADKELKKALAQADIVRQKTREILSAVHEGEAQNKDLEKALNDVKNSIKHIKSFLKS